MLKRLNDLIVNRLKDPTDVYSAIYPLYRVCSFVGLAPYSLKKKSSPNDTRTHQPRHTFEFGLWPIVKSALLVLALALLVVLNIIYKRAPFRDSDITEKLRYFQEVFSSLVSCCSVVFGCVFALKIIEVFRNIDEADTLFRALAVWVPYKPIYVKILAHLAGFIATIVGSLVYFAAIAPGFDVDHLYDITMLVLIVIIPYYVNVLMELQYVHYLNILRMRYKLLNEYLETLVGETKAPLNAWSQHHNHDMINSIGDGEKFVLSAVQRVPRQIVAISDPVFIVDEVAALHIKLTDTAHLINYAFCVQQLMRVTVAFVSIVTALFLIAVNFLNTDDNDMSGGGGGTMQRTKFDLFFTYWAFSNAMAVIVMVWITSETCEEANTCPRVLHKIRNNTNNVKLQDTIEIYSLQMYHNRLYFTVCGLFPLDYTLLYTIVAGVTTYLVILIQFNNADFVKGSSHNNSTSSFNNSTNYIDQH